MAFFLGIDGGASKTSCVLGDEQTILGRGIAGSSNVIRVGEATARESLTYSILQACSAAGISPSQITSTCVGVAGSERDEVRVPIQRFVGEVVAGAVQILGDMVVALQAAFGDGPGVIVVAGSGSIAYGRSASGDTGRAGGWGFAVSDEGSGYWIGRRAIATCLRTGDAQGKWDCELLSEVMDLLDVSTREQLILKVNASPPPNFASLAPAVLALSDRGDATAQSVLSAAGEELAALATVVLKRLFMNVASVPVAMSGGVFSNSAFVRQVFYNCLLAAFPPATLNPSVIDPVLGALELARKKSPG